MSDMSTQFESAPGWALAHHTMVYESISDAEIHTPDAVRGYVTAYKSDDDDKSARVKLGANSSGFSLSAYMTPARARKLAAALIEAADICEQFEAQQAEAA